MVVALFYFAGGTGLPLVLALYYQRGLGFGALQSALGVTALAVGSVSAPTAGRVVTRVGRPLVVGHLDVRPGGDRDRARARRPRQHAVLVLAGPLLVGLGAAP